MKLIAVVLNWNGGADTLRGARVARGIETICVDNGSTDGSDASVEERFPAVELIRTGANLGFAGGNNVGLRRAFERGADWVLLINNDAMAEPGLAEALAARGSGAARRRPARLQDPLRGRPDGAVRGCDVQRAAGLLRAADRLRHAGPADDNGVRDVGRADGAALALSRAAFEQVGGLDESLFMYVEDVELSLRVRAAGFARRARAGRPGAAQGVGGERRACLDRRTSSTRCATRSRSASATRRFRSVRAGFAARSSSARISLQALSHPARRDAVRAVVAGWRAARAGRSGPR